MGCVVYLVLHSGLQSKLTATDKKLPFVHFVHSVTFLQVIWRKITGGSAFPDFYYTQMPEQARDGGMHDDVNTDSSLLDAIDNVCAVALKLPSTMWVQLSRCWPA